MFEAYRKVTIVDIQRVVRMQVSINLIFFKGISL